MSSQILFYESSFCGTSFLFWVQFLRQLIGICHFSWFSPGSRLYEMVYTNANDVDQPPPSVSDCRLVLLIRLISVWIYHGCSIESDVCRLGPFDTKSKYIFLSVESLTPELVANFRWEHIFLASSCCQMFYQQRRTICECCLDFFHRASYGIISELKSAPLLKKPSNITSLIRLGMVEGN